MRKIIFSLLAACSVFLFAPFAAADVTGTTRNGVDLVLFFDGGKPATRQSGFFSGMKPGDEKSLSIDGCRLKIDYNGTIGSKSCRSARRSASSIFSQKDVDETEALKAAAANGDRESMNKLGEFYKRTTDWATAASWFEKAARLGHAQAQESLALLHATGIRGVPKNDEAAYFWYSAAARNASRKQGAARMAQKIAAGIAQRLPPDIVAAADQRLAAMENTIATTCDPPRAYYTVRAGRTCMSAEEARHEVGTAIRANDTRTVAILIGENVNVSGLFFWAAGQTPRIDPEILKLLLDHGTQAEEVKRGRPNPLQFIAHHYAKYAAVFHQLARLVEKAEKRRFFFNPPRTLHLHGLKPLPQTDCPAGGIALTRAMDTVVDIPAGCRTVMVKAWGAGGGNGGAGGFSAGLVPLPAGAKLRAIVGGGGQAPVGQEGGAGGFNGGGRGGAGLNSKGGNGGGGRSEVIIGDIPALIAGGGGGRYGSRLAWPGGGAHLDAYREDFFDWLEPVLREHDSGDGDSGDSGKGGGAGLVYHRGQRVIPGMTLLYPAPPTAGTARDGGNGQNAAPAYQLTGQPILNEAEGGAGGGGGHGGGGGSSISGYGDSHVVAGGGGGGGFAPPVGTTLWGGILYPANTDDPDYIKPLGTAGQDGLIVISWPAPDPTAFRNAALRALAVE